MPFIEAPTTFYLGRRFDYQSDRLIDEVIYYDSRDLTTHAVVVGMTGSGKTGLCITLLEEAVMDNIPAIIIDPKGDITNLLLTFPNLSAEEFRPWINEDDAARAGMSPQEYAQDVAQRWREGLASWGIGPQRIAEFKQHAQFSVFTPGSDTGLAISIVDALQPPREGWFGSEESHRERISGIVTALLALTGKKVNAKEREHVLISNIIENAWRQNMPLTIGDIIVQVQQPPFNTLGVFDIETFFPEKDRFKLAIEMNNIIASPSFQSWLEGEPLDVSNLLYNRQGQPRVSVFYIAHLNDNQREFIITLILESMLSWMRTLGGTSSLRAILYFDEVYGHFPPYPKNPPTKDPILRLLKQARAFGIGTILATQNPGDLDYKGLSNAGTWFIGKLQTENDKRKVLDGLATASSAENPIDTSQMDDLLSALDPRVFVLNNVHDPGGPVVMHTRWAMSYLRGPLTRAQVAQLMAPQKGMMAQGPYSQYHQPGSFPGQQQGYQQQGFLGQQQGFQQPGFQGQQQGAPGSPPPPPGLPEVGNLAPPPGLPEMPGFNPSSFGQQKPAQPPGAPQGFSSAQQPPLPQQGMGYGAQQSGFQGQPGFQGQQQGFQQQGFQGQTGGYQQPGTGGMPAQGQQARHQAGGLPEGFSMTPPSLSSSVNQIYLPMNMPYQQSLAHWEAQNNLRAGNASNPTVLYHPFLLAQCEVRYMDRKMDINVIEKYAYHVMEVRRSGLVRWDEHVAKPIQARSVEYQPAQGAGFGELPPGLTDRKRVSDLEKEVVDYIYKTAYIVLPANHDLNVYSYPGEPYPDFQARVNSVARAGRDEEIDKVTRKYEAQFDKLEDQYKREERELEADQASLQGLGRESLATMGEAALSLFRGRTTYTLSRVTRVRRYQEQAKQDVAESVETLQRLEADMDALQADFEREIARINDKWARLASNITEERVNPLKKDIHIELYGIAWKPFYFTIINGQNAMLPAWQGQHGGHQQPGQPGYQQQPPPSTGGFGQPANLGPGGFQQPGYQQPPRFDPQYGGAPPPNQPQPGWGATQQGPPQSGFGAPPQSYQGYGQPQNQMPNQGGDFGQQHGFGRRGGGENLYNQQGYQYPEVDDSDNESYY